MAQNPGHQGTTIPLSQLPAALEKAVELAKKNRITDRHIWLGFEIPQADAAAANELAATIATAIGGPNAQPLVLDVSETAELAAKTAAGGHAAKPAVIPPHAKIIGLKVN